MRPKAFPACLSGDLLKQLLRSLPRHGSSGYSYFRGLQALQLLQQGCNHFRQRVRRKRETSGSMWFMSWVCALRSLLSERQQGEVTWYKMDLLGTNTLVQTVKCAWKLLWNTIVEYLKWLFIRARSLCTNEIFRIPFKYLRWGYADASSSRSGIVSGDLRSCLHCSLLSHSRAWSYVDPR